ncbi:MAG: hypothetical protein HOV81_16700 [Kofleriaceae bacterium]|nr:hypothetical protein [Kofleriaceae bacterium]
MTAVPDAEVPRTPAIEAGIDEAVRYLDSDAALASIAADVYWPKWNCPWWQMTMLWELGEAARIPTRAAAAMVEGLRALRLHTFPIRPEDWPPNADRWRDTSCHCALGTIDQVLSACGVDVDAELPWVRPWYARYQMRDGGLNCDEAAYLVEDECPSSMVGTVAPFEAMIRRGPSEFLDRAAALLVARELRLGSPTRHNAEERDMAPRWLELAFPRFYFYDVLRGLTALVRWATAERRAIPAHAIAHVAEHLARAHPDGVVRVGRRPFDGIGTHARQPDGVWRRQPNAATFPLVEAVAVIGEPSGALTAEWRKTRHALVALIDAGLVQ